MSKGINKCHFIGNLGKDPEKRVLPSGGGVCNFSIGCGWKTKDKEGTEWVNCVAFGKLADICGEYLKKGSKVYIEGSLKTRKWQGQDGQDRYTTEIIASEMQMLDGKSESPSAPKNSPQAQNQGGSAGGDFDDSVPFGSLTSAYVL